MGFQWICAALATLLAAAAMMGVAPAEAAAACGAALCVAMAVRARRSTALAARAPETIAATPDAEPEPEPDAEPESEDPTADAALTELAALLRDGAFGGRLAAAPGREDVAAANAALEAAQSALDEAMALADLIAAGDLTVNASTAHAGSFGGLVAAVGSVAGALRGMIAAAQQAAGDVDAQTQALSSGADALALGVDRQRDSLAAARSATADVRRTLDAVLASAGAGDEAAQRAAAAAERSRADADAAREAASQVGVRSREIAKLLTAVSSVAQQSKLLGVNASVEAARAGEAGRGFAVVAAEIQALAGRSAETAKEIERQLAENDAAVAECAKVIAAGAETLERIGADVDSVREAAASIRDACSAQTDAAAALETRVGDAETAAQQAEEVVENTHAAARRLDAAAVALRDSLEGAHLEEVAMAQAAQTHAAEISRRFEAGVAAGRITMDDLFSDAYAHIEGTDPPQYMTPFVAFTDATTQDVIEAVLSVDPGVVFSCPINRDGFIPTHNLKVSQPQGADPVKNAALSRNRRFFTDRVGLAAGRSAAPSLIQAYRRDMGGGAFVTMKDASAPIIVNGRHWGGLRIGYRAADARLGKAA